MSAPSGHPPVRAGAVWRTAPWPSPRRLLNPLRLIPTAVFNKEVRAQGRRTGTYLARGIYATLLLALMAIVFTAFMSEQRHQSGARSVQEFQLLAPAMTLSVLWFQYVVLTLLSPILLGGAICDEKRTGTLATLLTTPLTAAQIVLGKLAGGLVQMIILALIATPMLLVIRVFGGVPASTIVAGLCVGVSMAVMAGCLALASSVTARRGTTAALTALILAAGFHGAPALIMAILNWKVKTTIPWDFMIITCSPMEMAVISSELMGGGGPPIRTPGIWIWSSVYSLSIAALAVLYATARLRRVMILEGGGAAAAPATTSRSLPLAPPADPSRPAPPTAAGKLARPRDSFGKPERDARDVGEHPVLWREVRQPVFAKKWQLPLLVVGIGGIMVWVYSVVGLRDREVHSVVGAIGMVAGILFAAVMPVAAITGEREARTWETLLTTRLSARQIVLGKIVGALKRQWVLPAMLLLNFVIAGVLAGTLRPIYLFHYAAIFAVAPVFLACTGVLASLLVKRSVHAAVLNAGLALSLWLGLPILMVVFDNLTRSGDFIEFLVVASNPVPLAVSAADGAGLRDSSWGNPPTRHYRVGDMRNLTAGTFTLFVLAHCAVYAALAAAAFSLAVKGFSRWGGRT